MPLGMEVGLSPNHIVLDGDAAPTERGTALLPTFRPFCLLWSNSHPSQQLLSSCLVLVFFIPLLFSFIGSVRHIKLAICQLLGAREYSLYVTYRIVSCGPGYK